MIAGKKIYAEIALGIMLANVKLQKISRYGRILPQSTYGKKLVTVLLLEEAMTNQVSDEKIPDWFSWVSFFHNQLMEKVWLPFCYWNYLLQKISRYGRICR